MSNLDYQYNDEIKCPYCDYEFSDSWEYASSDSTHKVIECHECGKDFSLEIVTDLTYSTEKLEDES